MKNVGELEVENAGELEFVVNYVYECGCLLQWDFFERDFFEIVPFKIVPFTLEIEQPFCILRKSCFFIQNQC
ncbi:MAG: hypothetical protein LBG52_06390 [Candidatus Peribacteria bacterium]|jgi:hypothetical protein|nr:hypothetical protein [Candidatus Peribacteria bacterium]